MARAARGLRQHAADRRAGRRHVQRGRQPDAPVPRTSRGDRGVLAGQGGRARAAQAVPRRASRTSTASRPSTRSASSARWASRATSWSTADLVQLRQGQRHPGRPGAWLGGRLPDRLRHGHHRARPDQAQAALRAVPQPRPHLDARHRHGLRRAPPRRHDPLRHREVRRGAGRPDHHVRHDQGQAGGQGQRPGPRLPVRAGRPHHQGDAAGGDGQGRAAVRHLRPDARRATPRRGSSGRCTSPTSTSGRSSTPRAGSRGSSGSGASTRPASSCAASRCSTSSRSSAASRTARSSPSSTWVPASRSACSRWTSSACATSPSSTTAWPTSRPTAARRSCSRTSTSTPTSTTYELLGRGDTLGVFQLDGGGCGRCCGCCGRPSFDDISAVIALYRPGPMGANAHIDYADRKNGRRAGRADPPRARRAAGRDPGRDLRVDRLPGAGHGDRAEAGRLHPRPSRPAAPRHGQEEERDPREGVPRLRGRHEGQRLRRRRDQDAVGHPGPVRRLRVQQGAHRRLRRGLVLDGVPQGQLPGRVHGGAAHLGPRRQGQERALPGRVPAHGHQGAAAGRQRVRRQLHPARYGHPVRPVRHPQRRRERRRVARRAPAATRAPTSTSPTTCARSRRSPATRRPSSR